MSDMTQKPAQEKTMNSSARDSRFSCSLSAGSSAAAPSVPARLQAIHDLIRSGDYHIPATAIADRMIERMIADKRRRTY
jgi:anti-sigma28 factor (negative regulator of flagellin synthesis)